MEPETLWAVYSSEACARTDAALRPASFREKNCRRSERRVDEPPWGGGCAQGEGVKP